jgi:hypothetical protein
MKRAVILSMTFSACVSIQLLAQAAAPFGPPATSAPQDSSCFLRRQWTGGWKVTSDSRTLYIRVSGQIYQLDLDAPHPLLQSAFAVIANRGSNDSICSPLDFRLVVSDRTGAEEWPIVRTMARLTPEQTSKLAKKLRP